MALLKLGVERGRGISDEVVRRTEIREEEGVTGCEIGRRGRKREERGEKEEKWKVQIEASQLTMLPQSLPGSTSR